MQKLLNKMKGGKTCPPRAPSSEIFVSAVGGLLGIASIGLLGRWLDFTELVLLFYVGSFGASAVLVYGIPNSPFAQPRNMVGGQIISALSGVVVYQVLPEPIYLSAAIAVSLTIALMHLTRTLHPPAGATALIAVIGGEQIHNLGYQYVLSPILIGTLIMLFIALIINNIPETRRYPQFWW
jgi:CBS-domain-containing membrane protein